MRFCMVTTFYPPYHFGGDAAYVRALSRGLVERGYEVEVVHCEDAYRLRGHPPAQAEREEEGIRVHRLKSRLGFLSPLITQQTGHPGIKAKALRALLRRRFDVVHFHNISLVGGPAVLGFSEAPVKLYTLHEHWLLCPTHIFWKNRKQACDRPQCFRCSLRSGIPPQLWRYSGLARSNVDKVDALLSPSEYTAQLHKKAGFTPPIYVLPLFSSLDPGPLTHYVPPPHPRFLYVGRITASKGIVPLLEQLAKLPDYDLWVVGAGDLLDSLQQGYRRHKNMLFMGNVPQAELAALYQGATALVVPSLAPETFGLSIVEAFACGTPAIVRNAGGGRELIDATSAGFIYQTEGELRQALHRLASDLELRQSLGARARAGYERYYTRQRHLDAYLEHVIAIQKAKDVVFH